MAAPARFARIAVMAREPVERELQHDLGRARRPGAFALDVFQALEEAADVEQQAGEFRADRIERLMHALARRDHGLGESAGALAAGAAAAGRDRARPVRGGARHQMGAGEIRAQPFAGLQLMRRDQGAAVAATAAREPGQRAFRLVDGDAGAAELGRDLTLRQGQMPAAEAVDRRPLRVMLRRRRHARFGAAALLRVSCRRS